MRRLEALAALAALAAALGCSKPAAERASDPAAPLFTGKEPKRVVDLYLPMRDRPGFAVVKREVYATASVVNQGKQLLQALMRGPRDDGSEPGVAPCFGPGARYDELYLDGQGLAVVDLPAATVAALPGGTSAEVATLYCLLRTLAANLPEVKRLQVLIDGAVPESLRGHLDLSEPLTLADF